MTAFALLLVYMVASVIVLADFVLWLFPEPSFGSLMFAFGLGCLNGWVVLKLAGNPFTWKN